MMDLSMLNATISYTEKLKKLSEDRTNCGFVNNEGELYDAILEFLHSYKTIAEAYADESMDYCSGYVRDVVAKEMKRFEQTRDE